MQCRESVGRIPNGIRTIQGGYTALSPDAEKFIERHAAKVKEQSENSYLNHFPQTKPE
jgi:hypothetical protein